MTKEVLVDGPHATAKSPAGARRVRRRGRRFPGAALEPGRMAADPPDSIAPPLERALEVGRERLGAAQRRVAALETERLRACVRTSDTACRYGGDEFVILLPELQGREGALAVARKIRARLAVPCIVDGVRIAVTASIGVAVYPADGRAYDDLMRVTDGCMYRDKARDAGRRAAA
jgi:hypothetical protein